MSFVAKITKKGQVTIPKKIREKLKTDIVYFEIKGDTVFIRAVKDVGGILSEYSKNARSGLSMRKAKERAWEEAIGEKIAKKTS